jgi:heme exporter protein B
MAAEARARDLLVPLMLLPFLTPVLIAAARATEPLFSVPTESGDLGKWTAVLGLYDLVFVLLSVAVFDFLLED